MKNQLIGGGRWLSLHDALSPQHNDPLKSEQVRTRMSQSLSDSPIPASTACTSAYGLPHNEEKKKKKNKTKKK